MIWKLKNLESLELDGRMSNRSSLILNDIHKLQKLKSLKIGSGMSRIILDHLKFGVFHDLEELDAYFEDISLDSIREMKRVTPNLKKIVICVSYSNPINALLETLENLKSVELAGGECEIPSEKFYPKIKYLHIYRMSDSDLSAEQITKTFPNLETLRIGICSLDEKPELFLVTLLSELKQLKTLDMEIWTGHELDRESVLQCFQQHGKHLDDVFVRFSKEGKTELIFKKTPGGRLCCNNKTAKARPLRYNCTIV
jgi:hypothetical protein